MIVVVIGEVSGKDFPDPTDDDIFNGFIETMGIDMNEEAIHALT